MHGDLKQLWLSRKVLGITPRMQGVVLLSFGLGLLRSVHQLAGAAHGIPWHPGMVWELAHTESDNRSLGLEQRHPQHVRRKGLPEPHVEHQLEL